MNSSFVQAGTWKYRITYQVRLEGTTVVIWSNQILSTQRWLFKALWRKCLQQPSHHETWTQNPFWQPEKVVNSWKVRETCTSLSIQIQLLCKYMIVSSLTLLLLSDQLSYSVRLFCWALLKGNDLIQFTLYWRIDFSPAHSKQQILGRNLKWFLLCGFYRCPFSCLGSQSVTKECMKCQEANSIA